MWTSIKKHSNGFGSHVRRSVGSQEKSVFYDNMTTEDPRFETMREEVMASSLMKELTLKYGTKGKSAKHIFLQAFQEGQRPESSEAGTKSSNPADLVCPPDLSKAHVFMDDFEEDWESELLESSADLNKNSPITQALARPAAMVAQSHFVKRLIEQVKLEIVRAGCSPPTYEMSCLNEQMRNGMKFGAELTYDSNLVQDEPEEKMVARLKIYKRAFSALILHFEALRPILKDIKRNYDTMLVLRERQVTEATKIKQNVHHLELSLDEKMATSRFEGFKQLAELEKQCFLLMRHVDRQDLAMRTMTDILNKLETSLSEEHDLRRDSEDQRKLLVVEINELRRKLGMAPRQALDTVIYEEEEEEAQEIDAITTEDPIILRRGLEITRKNLSDAHQRLTVLEADYADVIPRHEFEELQTSMKRLEGEYAENIKAYERLSADVSSLKAAIEVLTGDRNNLQDILSDMRTKATPRPSWEKVAEHIEGGLPKWKSIYQGKSSADIVPILVQELTGKKLIGPPEYIQPLGTSSEVPKYLRHNTAVRRRDFSRRDVIVVLNDIWQTRAEILDELRRYNEAKEEEANGGYGNTPIGDVPESMPVILPFEDYVLHYFETRFHLTTMRMEWIYNILESCNRLGPLEPKMKQFVSILQGKTNEGVYHLLREQIAKLRNTVIAKSEETNQPAGSIQFGHFIQAIRENFKEKTEDEIQRLIKSASKQTGVHADFSIVKYIAFFAMTDEGLIGLFVDEFSKQYEEDRTKYVYEVLAEVLSDLGVSLSSAEREHDPAGETDVNMNTVFSAFAVVDPTLPDKKIGAALAWIFFGQPTLPGANPKGCRLVEYLRTKSRAAEGQDEEQDEEDEDFERAITDLLSEKEATELTEMEAKGKKRWLMKKKVTNLGTVVQRLKGGPFLRFGPRIFSTDGNNRDEGNSSAEQMREKESNAAPKIPVKEMDGLSAQKTPPAERADEAAIAMLGPTKKDKKRRRNKF